MIRAARRGGGAGDRLLTLALAALCLLGLVRLAQGLAVPAKAAVAQVLLDRAFARSRAAGRAERPWAWADMAPVARISIARLGLAQVVLGSGSGQAMAFAPTLLPGGAAFGAPGTAVVAAHRDTHFRFLGELRPGDVVAVEPVSGPPLRFRVTGAEVVRWDRFAVPARTGPPALALATCWPLGAVRHGPLRYVVHAEMVG